MSWQPAEDPKPVTVSPVKRSKRSSCRARGISATSRSGGLLPSSQRQMVGPFIFFDQMGPAEFLLGAGMDVRPHPHIGLSTVTYLFDGEIMHRDSLGTVLPIRPGELNWMTAGRGSRIRNHAARSCAKQARDCSGSRAGLLFHGMTRKRRRISSTTTTKTFPCSTAKAKRSRSSLVRFCRASPVKTSSPMIMPMWPLRQARPCRSIGLRRTRSRSWKVKSNRRRHSELKLLVFRPGDRITITAKSDARFMMLGGEPMDGQGSSGGISFLRERAHRTGESRLEAGMLR